MGTHPIFESDFDCLTECYALSGGYLLCTATRAFNLTTTFLTTQNQFLTSSTSNNTSICSKALISELYSNRSKTDFRLIGRRFGKVIKLNRDNSLPAQGFISNQTASPVLFFEDESPDVSMDFGYFKYD